MLSLALEFGFLALGLALLLCLGRLLAGPSPEDRVLALDKLSINAVAILVLLGVRQGTAIHFEAALLIAALGFIGTLALLRFLLHGRLVTGNGEEGDGDAD